MSPLVASELPASDSPFEGGGPHAAAWQSVRDSYLVLVERVESGFAEAGLPDLAWFDVLGVLAATDEPLRPRDLLCRVRVTKSGLTRLLDRIEAGGLIRRSRCPSDRRGTFLTITDDGRKTLARMLPIREDAFRTHFERVLTEEEAETVAVALCRVTESVRAELASGYREPV